MLCKGHAGPLTCPACCVSPLSWLFAGARSPGLWLSPAWRHGGARLGPLEKAMEQDGVRWDGTLQEADGLAPA